MSGGMQGPQDTSFYAMRNAVQQSVSIIKSDPGVQNVMGFTGGQGAANSGFTFIALKPLNERKVSAEQIIEPVAAQACAGVRRGDVSCSRCRTSASAGGNRARSINTRSKPRLPKTCRSTARCCSRSLKKLPAFRTSIQTSKTTGCKLCSTYDRPTAARLGITPQLLDNTLYDAFGQAEVSTIYTQLNQYYVVMEVAPKYWASPDGLKDTYVIPNAGGGAIPLSSVLKYVPSTSPLSVNHTGLFPSVTVSFNLATGVSLGQATQEIQQVQQKLGMPQSHPRAVLGNTGSVRGVAGQRAVSDSDRHIVGVCRAGNSL